MKGEGHRPHSRFPTVHQLKASVRAAVVLADRNGTTTAQATTAWVHTPTDGMFSATDLATGASILAEAGLIRRVGDLISADESLYDLVGWPEAEACEAIAFRLLDRTDPLWLSAATSGGMLASEFVPSDVAANLAQVIPDAERREELLLQLGQKFDDEDRLRVGDLAERCVEEACRRELEAAGRPDLSTRVRRVSLTSDALGYDITAPRLDASIRRIESKGTRQEAAVVAVVLSRNEAETARRYPDWALVVSRVNASDEAAVVGWTTSAAIMPDLPVDTKGRWMSTTIYIDTAELHPGLPPIDARSMP